MIMLDKTALKDVIAICEASNSCFYCGERATQDEHVVAQVYDVETWTVRSCWECNALAGQEPFATITHKHEYIRDRRRLRYAKLLKMPEWTEDDLDEMGTNLRNTIIAYQRARDVVKTQIDWQPFPRCS